eukprot:6204604-Pleurochrysis_carterae.AAC.1
MPAMTHMYMHQMRHENLTGCTPTKGRSKKYARCDAILHAQGRAEMPVTLARNNGYAVTKQFSNHPPSRFQDELQPGIMCYARYTYSPYV